MKKFNFKTRMQVGWFKAAMFGTVVGILLAPTAGKILTDKEKAFLTENPLVSAISSISFGPKIKVMINGDVVALAPSEEAAQNAYPELSTMLKLALLRKRINTSRSYYPSINHST